MSIRQRTDPTAAGGDNPSARDDAEGGAGADEPAATELERPDALANVDTTVNLPTDAADWGIQVDGTKGERLKSRVERQESKKKQREEARKRKLMRRKMRLQTSNFPANLLWLSLMCFCACIPVAGILYYRNLYNGLDNIMPGADVERMTLLQATIWGAVAANGACILLTCYGFLAVTSKTLGQMKKYMRYLGIVAIILFLPVLVLIAYNMLNMPVSGGGGPFEIWTNPNLTPESLTQSMSMTYLLLLGLDEVLGFLTIGVAYYAALMYRDELKEDLRNRELQRHGKRPRPPRVTPRWAKVCWSLVPSKAKIIWLMKDPMVGVIALMLAAFLNIVVGVLSISSGGAFTVVSGCVRIGVAVYGFWVIRERRWSRIFAYGRVLTLMIMLLIVTSIAYMATLLDDKADAGIVAAGDSIDINSILFVVLFGVVGAMEVLLMFWCLWCSINYAHGVEKDEAARELAEAEAELLAGQEEGDDGAGIVPMSEVSVQRL